MRIDWGLQGPLVTAPERLDHGRSAEAEECCLGRVGDTGPPDGCCAS